MSSIVAAWGIGSLTAAVLTLWKARKLRRPLWLLVVRIVWVTGAWALIIFVFGFWASL